MNLPDGRNDIPVNNSGAKCLLENWVEERAVAPLEPVDANAEYTSTAQLRKHGHKGLLTVELEAAASRDTTVRDSYAAPQPCGVRTLGRKLELTERALYRQFLPEVQKAFIPMPPPQEFISTRQQDYDIPDFESIPPPPTKDHNHNTDNGVTFWSTHVDKITGVSQVKSRTTPFKKNSAFSKPISEYLDQTMPYDAETYPDVI